MSGSEHGRLQAISRMLDRIDSTAAEAADGFPHFADPVTGRWTRSADGDWTGGFWNGLLWLAGATTKEQQYWDLGRLWAQRLLPRTGSETVFRGFLFWYGAALGSLLADDDSVADVALQGAAGLRELYNPSARVIPLGDAAEEASDVGRSDANIDGVPGGTPLLIWAARRTGDPALESIAIDNASRHVELCVRDDSSVCQSASFDPTSGETLRRYSHKGFSDSSTWARAQAWAMLGFAQAAVWHPDPFAAVGQRVADWWVDHLPENRVAYWDFDDPAIPHASPDTSGTAIAAAALLKLATTIPERATVYRDCAAQMVDALVAGHLTPVGPADARPPGILADGCYNRHIGLATSHELIWGSYFLFESLLVLAGQLDPRAV